MRHARTTILWPLLLAATLQAWACVPPEEPADPTHQPGALRWTLAWDGQGVQVGDHGTWEVTSPEGLRFVVTRGHLTNLSMELVECPEEVSGLGSALRDLLLGPVAWAGHGQAPVNPASVSNPGVEVIGPAQTTEAGRAQVQPARYCLAHYLVARFPQEAPQAPEPADMEGASLHLEGVAIDAQGRQTPFTVHTSLAAGVLHDLYPPGGFNDPARAFALNTATQGAEVTITRPMAALFEGIDPATMSDRELERGLLRNLINHTLITVTPR